MIGFSRGKLDQFDKKMGADALKKVKGSAITGNIGKDKVSAWVQLGDPWIKYIGGGSSKTDLLATVGIKNISAAQLKELSAIGATVENGEKLSFAVDKYEKVQKILGTSFSKEDFAKSVNSKKGSILKQPGISKADCGTGWSNCWGDTIDVKEANIGNIKDSITGNIKNSESTWVKICGGDPWVKSLGKTSDAILRRDKVTAEQVKALSKIGATIKNTNEIVFEASKLNDVKKILGEK